MLSMNWLLAFFPLLLGVVLSYLASYVHTHIAKIKMRDSFIRPYGAILIPLSYLILYLLFGSI